MSSQQPNNSYSLFVDAFIAFTLIALFTLSFFLFPKNISFGLTLIVGFWSVDAYLKKIFAYKNTTAFADLSFTALVFAGGEGISLIKSNLNNKINVQQLFIILFVALVLCIAWLGNVAVCRGLEGGQPSASTSKKALIWIVSFMFAFFSVCGALYVHNFGSQG